MKVYLHDWPDPSLYVEHANGELSVVRDMSPGHWPVFRLPETAVELLPLDEQRPAILDEVRAALAAVSMSKTARAAVAAALDDLIGDEA